MRARCAVGTTRPVSAAMALLPGKKAIDVFWQPPFRVFPRLFVLLHCHTRVRIVVLSCRTHSSRTTHSSRLTVRTHSSRLTVRLECVLHESTTIRTRVWQWSSTKSQGCPEHDNFKCFKGARVTWLMDFYSQWQGLWWMHGLWRG